jgi:hypothetical protein
MAIFNCYVSHYQRVPMSECWDPHHSRQRAIQAWAGSAALPSRDAAGFGRSDPKTWHASWNGEMDWNKHQIAMWVVAIRNCCIQHFFSTMVQWECHCWRSWAWLEWTTMERRIRITTRRGRLIGLTWRFAHGNHDVLMSWFLNIGMYICFS